jgi:hypothetical protein
LGEEGERAQNPGNSGLGELLPCRKKPPVNVEKKYPEQTWIFSLLARAGRPIMQMAGLFLPADYLVSIL